MAAARSCEHPGRSCRSPVATGATVAFAGVLCLIVPMFSLAKGKVLQSELLRFRWTATFETEDDGAGGHTSAVRPNSFIFDGRTTWSSFHSSRAMTLVSGLSSSDDDEAQPPSFGLAPADPDGVACDVESPSAS